ncbi:hypothetical protein K474DRAFT_1263083 [Panus rudis PR-1116 ss-1]|nr:hypothetical protein K474DRAFT_1263083 [Panus rudis PR-1116 ss-1]
MRLTLTSALVAFSLISYVFAHPLAVEPDSRVSELAERDVDHFQWLERRITPEEEAAQRRLQRWRDYEVRRAERIRNLRERAAQGDPQAQAELDAAVEARRASNRAASKHYRDRQSAAQGLIAMSRGQGAGSSSGGGSSSRTQVSQGGSSAYGSGGQSASSGYRQSGTGGTRLPSIQELDLPRPPLHGSQQGRGQSGQGYYQGQPSSGAYGGSSSSSSSQYRGYQGGRSSGGR